MAWPQQTQYGARSPYYNWRSLYGAKKDWSGTEAVAGPTGYLESDPNAIWTRFTAPFAGGDDAFSRFVASKQKDVWDAYAAAAATNPNLTHQQFLQGFSPQFFRNQFAQLGEQARGLNTGLYRGRARWVSNG